MRIKSILFMLLLAATTMNLGIKEAAAATSVQVAAPGFNFSLSDYQPIPANVYVYQNEGRPYYMERDRRVYMQKKHHGNKKYKKYKKHHEDNGKHKGHDKH